MKSLEADSVLQQQVDSLKTPSLQYALFNKDEILHEFRTGYADILNQKVTDSKTTYHLYSVTKTFTAIGVLQLVSQNKCSINDNVKVYLEDFPYPGDITIKHLLNHTSGIPNPIPLSWIHLMEEHKDFDANNYFKKIIHNNQKVKFRPNSKFAYSNLGYVFLGKLIEKISGQGYENFIIDHILKPLHLSGSDLSFTILNPENHAKGYHKKNSFTYFLLDLFIDTDKYMSKTEGKWKAFKNNYVNGAPYGGLIGTSDSLVRYAQDLLSPDSRLLNDEFKTMLFTPNNLNNNKPTGMCLSWYTGQLNGVRYFTHAGGGGGYYCEVRIYPSNGIGSVILFNRTGMTDERFLDKIDKFMLEEF